MYVASKISSALLLKKLNRDTRFSTYCDSCCDIFRSVVNISRARLNFEFKSLVSSLCLTRSKQASQLCERLNST